MKKGDLHELKMGASGRDFDPICPVYKEEFDLKFLSTERHGFIKTDVSSEKIEFTFIDDAMNEFYSLRIDY